MLIYATKMHKIIINYGLSLSFSSCMINLGKKECTQRKKNLNFARKTTTPCNHGKDTTYTLEYIQVLNFRFCIATTKSKNEHWIPTTN